MTPSAVLQVTKSEGSASHTDAGISNSQALAPPFPARDGGPPPTPGKIEPGLSPVLTPLLCMRLPSTTDDLGDLRCPWELNSTGDGSRVLQAAGRESEALS